MLSQMELRQAVEELQQINLELAKQHKLRILRKILKLFLVGFFVFKEIEKMVSELKVRKDSIVSRLKEHICEGLENIEKQVEEVQNSGTYLIYVDKERCVGAIKSFKADLAYLEANKVLEEQNFSDKKEELEKHLQLVLNYNNEFIKQRKRDYDYLFNKKTLSLDKEQKDGVIIDDKYNLVVAGAGSGKTEVLITRIAYLIKRKPDGIEPNRILAIVYQRKAREEIEQRLRVRYKIGNVSAKTFHKLGKDILGKAGKKFRHTDIVDNNKKHGMIKRIFEGKLRNEPDYYKLFLQYVKTLHDVEQEEDFKSKDDYFAYMRQRPYFSINNTRVNSRAEKEILDFFLMNKLDGKPVDVEYEPDVAGFRPDFYLDKYDLFIEHWGINEKGEVPEWFSQSSEEYEKNMERKREWFARHDKLLVETFAYEYDEHNPAKFIELLKKRVTEKLQARYDGRFEFTPMTYEEIVEVAWGPYRNPIDEIVNFVTNAKTYGITPERVVEKLRSGKWSSIQLAFGNLAVKVYRIYEEELRSRKKIDFEDMINLAINELTKDKDLYANVYDHILIDEYQDISAQRHKLIKKLLERNPKCKLFCIGDDWQSIMSFAGSNLNFFVNFDKYFKNPAVTKLSTNYRSIKTIVNAGADLIKNNQSQISKATLSSLKEASAIKVLRSPHKKEFEWRYYEQTAEDCLNRISEYIQSGYAPNDILVLSRYMRTRGHRGYKFLPIARVFMEKAQENDIPVAYEQQRAKNKVRLLTVHKSKGLEAQVVFILNVIKGVYGFPCELEDPSIYAPVRENYPLQDQKEEERRLFYVAMTRAKKDLFVYTWEPSKSEFLEEIKDYTTEERLSY